MTIWIVTYYMGIGSDKNHLNFGILAFASKKAAEEYMAYIQRDSLIKYVRLDEASV